MENSGLIMPNFEIYHKLTHIIWHVIDPSCFGVFNILLPNQKINVPEYFEMSDFQVNT